MLSSSMQESTTTRVSFPEKDPKEWELFYGFIQPATGRDRKVTKDNVLKMLPWFHEFLMEGLLGECDAVMVSLVPHSPANCEELFSFFSVCDFYGLANASAKVASVFKSFVTSNLETVDIFAAQKMIELSRRHFWMWEFVESFLLSDLENLVDDESLLQCELLAHLLLAGMQQKIQEKKLAEWAENVNKQNAVRDKARKKLAALMDEHSRSPITAKLKAILADTGILDKQSP